MARRRQAGTGIKTQGMIRSRSQRKTEQGYETGMLDQVPMQVAHRSQAFIEFDQRCGGQRRVGNGGVAPMALQVPFGEVIPIERPEQVETPLDGQ